MVIYNVSLTIMAKKVKVTQMPEGKFLNNAEVLGQVVKAKRTALGIKLADCAALCGIGINTLSRIENGNSNCTLSTAFAALNGLGINLISNEVAFEETASTLDDEWV